MTYDIHSSYIYDHLPQLSRTPAKAGFRSFSSDGSLMFRTTLGLRNISNNGPFSQYVPRMHERYPLETDYNLHCRYFTLQNLKVPTIDRLSSADFYRMREFKERNNVRKRDFAYPNTMQGYCSGCSALNVGGTAGCMRFKNYGLQNADQKLHEFTVLPFAPYGRGKYHFFHEDLDRIPTNNFWNSKKHT